MHNSLNFLIWHYYDYFRVSLFLFALQIVYRFAIQNNLTITWVFFLFGWYSTCFPSSVLEKQDIRKTITWNFLANRLFEENWDQVCPNGNGFVQGRTTLFVFLFKRFLKESCLREIEKKSILSCKCKNICTLHW